ncbi:MAG TPA: redoxin domain-containing protein, partial [Gemmataceae bacterium]|nr:redoxin domain-containing protein [Gemmataceae bacterium]
MRSLACLVIFVVGCLIVPGCAIFNKKGTDSKTPAGGTGSATPPAKFPTSSDPLINGGNVSQAYGGAVLAGRVIDNFSKPPANTSIRLVSLDGKETSNPTDVNVTPEGYFTIQGLKSGASYKLLARGKNGDHLLAGITCTRAPNLTVVIQVKEEFANSGTPDVQGSPAFQDKNPAKVSSLDQPNFSNTNITSPGGGHAGNDVVMPPVSVPNPGQIAPSTGPANQVWVPAPSVASDKGSMWPPTLDIPNPTIKPAPPQLLIPKTMPAPSFPPNSVPSASRLDGPARVPSCVRVGNTFINFALNDLNGEPWEYKRNRLGKLTLIDFWSTTCQPCIQTIPSLVNLQNRHPIRDLEVLGIAVETGGNAQEQAYRVSQKATSMHINYRQLLSSSAVCPVCKDFRIDGFPTMVLLDQSGAIIWEHKGRPNRDELAALERLINYKLDGR